MSVSTWFRRRIILALLTYSPTKKGLEAAIGADVLGETTWPRKLLASGRRWDEGRLGEISTACGASNKGLRLGRREVQ
jgi:hypothetical protein